MPNSQKSQRLPRLRIAQLSDLHCDGTEEWAENFRAVGDMLREAKPDLILITGDCADHPRARFYSQLRGELDALRGRVRTSTGKQVPICAIPGNHDYNYFGNQFFGFLRINPFRDGLTGYIADSGAVPAELSHFAQQHRVAIYPFDSNRSKIGKVAFARGRVDKPREKFQKLAEHYRALFPENGDGWEQCIHIAILHHHPLPLPDTVQAQQLEQFHILDNAAEFLGAACSAGVHLVLHGHKHVSGMAEYRYTGTTDSTHSVCVSACGTSSKVGAPEREVCLFDVLRTGSIVVRRVRATPIAPTFDFHDDADNTREIIRYAYRRKRRARTRENWLLPDAGIRSIRTKTKVVRIVENGRGYVKITLDGLEWANGVDHRKPAFREFLHGGIGRVAGGWHVYLDGQGNRRSRMQTLSRDGPFTLDQLAGFDSMWVDLPAIDETDSPPSRFELRYLLHSGYCLSARDFLEAYHVEREQPCEEMSTIEVLAPTETAELIVTFPPGKMPSEDQIYLDAWLMPDGKPSQDLRVSRRTHDRDEDETNFLKEKGAIHYRPELNQISAVIRHPQPSVAYTLGWSLPMEPTLTKRNELQRQFRRNLETLTMRQHGIIENAIRGAFDRPEIRVSVFVYEPPSRSEPLGRLKLVQPADQKTQALVGRGIVGQGFRSRQLQYHTMHPLKGGDRRATDTQIAPEGTPDEYLWVESVLYEPLDSAITEILVIPLCGPAPRHGAINQTMVADAPVAGVLVLARYGEACEDSSDNFFPFDLALPEGRRAAVEMVNPLIGTVEQITMSSIGL